MLNELHAAIGFQRDLEGAPMFPRAILILVWLALGTSIQAAVLRGIVIATEIGGPPIENVAVSAEGAARSVTGANGTFSLEFPDRQAGGTIRLTVKKRGYEVVNDVQLDEVTLSDENGKPLSIILCKKGNREELARRYWRLKLKQAIESNHLQDALECNHQRIMMRFDAEQNGLVIFEDRDAPSKAMSATGNIEDGVARIEIGDSSELCRKAMRLFLDGKPAEAINALDEKDLRASFAAAIEKGEPAMEDAVQPWLLKAQFYIVQLQFSEAEAAYKAAIDLNPNGFDARFAMTCFHQAGGSDTEAWQAYLRIEEWAKTPGREKELAMTLNNQGVLCAAHGHRYPKLKDTAREKFGTALKIFRDLAVEKPETYLPRVAMTLDNLSGIYFAGALGTVPAAPAPQEEEVKVNREMARRNPEVYLPDLSNSLNRLAVFYEGSQLMEKSRGSYLEALTIRRELSRTNPTIYLEELDESLVGLALLFYSQARFREARTFFEEATRILREQAKSYPEAFNAPFLDTLNVLNDVNRRLHRTSQAEAGFLEGLTILHEPAPTGMILRFSGMPPTFDYPEKQYPYQKRRKDAFDCFGNELYCDRTDFLRDLGDLYRGQKRDQKRRKDALACYQEELAIVRHSGSSLEMANTLSHIGDIQRQENNMGEARTAYEEALKIFRDEKYGYTTCLPETLEGLAELNRRQNRIREAREGYKEALQLYQKRVKGELGSDPAAIPRIKRTLQLLNE